MAEPSNGTEPFECLAALSVVLDLANGLAEDKSLLCAAFSLRLAREAGCAPDVQWSALLAALLRHLGCTAYAAWEAELAPDDVRLRAELLHADSSQVSQVLRVVATQGGLAGVARLALRGPTLRAEWTREACGAARVLAEQLRLGPAVAQALEEVYERFDGAGSPRGLGGEALGEVGRLAQVAHLAVVFWLAGGRAGAREVLRARQRALDPRLARLGAALLEGLPERPADWLATAAPELEAMAAAHPLPVSLLEVAQAFGDFADLQSPASRGHSRAVARLCARQAEALTFSPEERATLALAAHLHDVGQAAVPTSLFTAARALRPSERERVRAHVHLTERVLASAPPLAAVARLAGAHHERLDGGGYHRGLGASQLPRAARALAVAEVAAALEEARPHRPALGPAPAAAALRAEVAAGALDGACVEALLGSGRGRAPPGAGPLSPRELEVLRLLARGKTNKEIAAALGLSPRTVQHHSIHVYGKLGVDTRAGAALAAAQRGLL